MHTYLRINILLRYIHTHLHNKDALARTHLVEHDFNHVLRSCAVSANIKMECKMEKKCCACVS